MSEPKDHMRSRPLLESVLRYIPGFRGYLEKEYRRDSDRLQRQQLTDHLQRSKRTLDAVGKKLVAAGMIDEILPIDHLRTRIDHLISRIDGATQGYSGFFDLVQIGERELDQLYEYDHGLLEQVHALSRDLEALSSAGTGDVPAAVAVAQSQVETLHQLWDQRESLQKGLGETTT